MIGRTAFDHHAKEYDAWYDSHAEIYKAELQAVKKMLPVKGVGLEVGAGSGRFAGSLNIVFGAEPSFAMAAIARKRNVSMTLSVAEALPYATSVFDYVVFITSLCFVDSVTRALQEAHRVLRTGGSVVIGLINPDSELGRQYEMRRQDSLFYRDARFITLPHINRELAETHFVYDACCQTLMLSEEGDMMYKVEPGCDRGSFLVLRALAG